MSMVPVSEYSSPPAGPTPGADLRERMTRDLQLRGYSPRTQEAYLRAVTQLPAFYGIAPDRLKEEQVRITSCTSKMKNTSHPVR